jgi:tetratricopeptide (TPR) repeat protein
MTFLDKSLIPFLSALLFAWAITAQADPVTNARELAILPAYCQGTQGISSISKLPKAAIDDYYKVYGETYHHLHHYCWALMSEFNANRILEKGPRNNKLNQALGDIQYVLNKNPPNSFPPLADIYASRARILLKLGRQGEAVADLIRAIDLQPDNQRTYAQLSDYYLDSGRKDKAIEILEQGVAHHESPTILLRRLERLGKPFAGTPGSAVPKPHPTTPEPAPSPEALPAPDPSSPAQAHAADSNESKDAASTGDAPGTDPGLAPYPQQNKTNPYCRFCP